MNKILFILLLLPCFVFGQTTDATLTTQAQQIKNETTAGANTANRVGTHLQNLVYSKKSFFVDGTASGTDTYSVTLDNGAITALTSQWFVVKFTNGNTGAATLNINAIGAKSLVKTDGTALSSGDIDAGSVHLLSYDGTNLQVLSLGGGGGAGTPGGSDTQVQFNNAGAFGGDADFTFTGGNTLNVDFVIVDTEVYGSGWNADNGVPTKDAVYDKIEASISIPQASVSTATGTITLDMESLNAKSFYGSATFSGPKTLAMSNVNDGCSCLSSFNFWFEVTNVAAVLTFPADWFSGNADFNGTTWTPPAVGIYEFGGSYNDNANRWSIKISNVEQ